MPVQDAKMCWVAAAVAALCLLPAEEKRGRRRLLLRRPRHSEARRRAGRNRQLICVWPLPTAGAAAGGRGQPRRQSAHAAKAWRPHHKHVQALLALYILHERTGKQRQASSEDSIRSMHDLSGCQSCCSTALGWPNGSCPQQICTRATRRCM